MTETGQEGAIVREDVVAPGGRGGRRTRRSVEAMRAAFVDLMFERGYHRIRVCDIVERADVGRSTFYDHFRGKDDILLLSMGWMLDTLAALVDPETGREPLAALLDHFWVRRQLARTLFVPGVQRKLRGALAAAVERRLAQLGRSASAARMGGVTVAAAQLALLEGWTRGEFGAGASEIADALVALSRR